MSASRVQNTSGDGRRVDGEAVAMELVSNDNDAVMEKMLNMNSRIFFFFTLTSIKTWLAPFSGLHLAAEESVDESRSFSPLFCSLQQGCCALTSC